MENNGENSGPLTSLPVDRLMATDCNAAARAKKKCTRIPNFCNSWGWNNAFKLTRAKIKVVCTYLSVVNIHGWSWLFTIVTCSHLSPVHIITVTESHYNVYHKHVTDNCKWGRKPWFYMHKNCWHNSWNGVLGRSMFLPYKIVVGIEGRGVTA